jgi:hypothetical protein
MHAPGDYVRLSDRNDTRQIRETHQTPIVVWANANSTLALKASHAPEMGHDAG